MNVYIYARACGDIEALSFFSGGWSLREKKKDSLEGGTLMRLEAPHAPPPSSLIPSNGNGNDN